MFKKFSLGMLAAIVAIAFSAFTMPKKTAPAMKATDLYWYAVDMQTNQVPQNATYTIHSSKSNAEALEICPEGNERDCLRGFTNQLNTSNGPVSSPGDDQIKQPQP